MSGWLVFIYGLAAGGLVGCIAYLRLNESWYRKSREVAKGITNDFTAMIREISEHVPDTELAAQLRAEADKADEVWL